MIGAAGLPGVAALAVGLLLFAVALLVRRWRRPAETGGTRDATSMFGIALQGLAFFVVAAGPARLTLDPLGTAALAQTAVTAALMATALALFVSATAAMGRNWSIVARTRTDHMLITHGPFARMRHPIYTALALVVVAMGIALGREARLLLALPLYTLGTWLRVRIEERLLRTMFDATYDAYAARVKRFVPGVF